MPRTILIPFLLVATAALIGLMTWVSMRMYYMERLSVELLQLQEHEGDLGSVIWEIESSALAIHNTCVAELSIPEGQRQFVKAKYTLNGTMELNDGKSTSALELCSSLLEVANNEQPVIKPDVSEKESSEEWGSYKNKVKLKKSKSYSTRAQNVWNQKGAIQQAILANSNIPTLDLNTEGSFQTYTYGQPINNTPFQSGWLKGKLYLFRKGLQASQIEAVLLDHKRITKKLSESYPEVTLTPSEKQFVTIENGQLKLIPAEKVPYTENTLVTLPYLVNLPMPEKAKLNPAWLRNLAITWMALILTIGLASLFIFNLVRLNKRRSQFVSSVTHELRTPLTSFQLYAEMLRDDLVPSAEKRKSYLETLNVEAKRLSHLVENVLAYSRIEGGKLVQSTVEIEQILPPIIDRLLSRIAQTKASLRVENSLPQTISIKTDPTAIEQILFNLVDNACKYALDKDPTQEILLSIEQESKYLVFTLEDKGPGIPKKEQQKLFQPFHKSAEKAADTLKPGVGLGLSIAKRQAKLLGGNLSLQSSELGACRFILKMPN